MRISNVPAALVDTNVILARADPDDQNHETAREIVAAIDHGDLPTGRITNYIVAEVLNFTLERRGQQYALEVYERIKQSAGFEIVHAARKDFPRALELFETYDGLSFVDATVAGYMNREQIEYVYSFDDDFDGVDGITRLTTAVSPFE